ncbi:MAG: hypothetical protein QF721_02835 [Verrucomicrobiota bacterium]|nr:hypothetical protein [Verrucomicrobiota bacterium]MDP7048365.1 hypothetical protein [Verrucomicrobiota bacterium]
MSSVIRTSLLSALLFGAVAFGQAAEEGKGLGDGHDGNRASITHLIELFDENDVQIKETDRQPRPVSMRVTCGKCHDYDTIATGWHFHSGSTNVLSGRVGEPWMLTDNRIRTQIPISDRGWKGTYKPSDIDLTAWKFLKKFSSHHPGGGYGEVEPSDEEEDGESPVFLRSQISGKYEINCLACHHADRKHNQSDAALEAAKQNYRWAATVSSGLATVNGNASELEDIYDPEFDGQKIITHYDKSRFNSENKVFLDIVRKPPSNRCYFCHSTQDLQTPGKDEWVHNEDIHITSGMSCADCHRNGADHMISRGDIEPSTKPHGSEEYLKAYDPKKVASYSCQGCHMGNANADDRATRMGGHLGAPVPEHKGIPPVHFEKLSCTACHSGRLPATKTGRVRTARMHKLGRHGPHGRVQPQLPHVVTPVFARMANGKIGPHNMIWPSFWGTQTNGVVRPLASELVRELAPEELGLDIEEPDRVNDWIELKEEQIGGVLKAIAKLNEKREEGQPELAPVYVAGGQLYRLSSNGVVVSETHEVGEPYKWPIAHDVRPAAQSLGSNGRCADCHDKNAPLIFGQVEVDTPLNPAEIQTVAMTRFGGLDEGYYQMFAFTFLFRPWLKGVVIVASVLLGLVLLLFALKGLDVVVRAAANKAADEE